ncbi:E2/UBC family protein [Aurantivibrio infirmus]
MVNHFDHTDSIKKLLIEQHNFWPSPRKENDLFFSGKFNISGRGIVVEFRFHDALLLEPPEAFLVDWPHDRNLRNFLGTRHIEANGRLCFYDPSRDVWDATTAIRHLSGAIEKINGILNSNVNDPNDEVWLQDFQGYWGGSKIYLASKPSNGKIYNLWNFKGKKWLVDSQSFPEWMRPEDRYIDRWYAIKLPNTPKPSTENWPPSTVSEMLLWFSEFMDKPEIFLANILLREQFKKRDKGTHTLSKGFIFYDENSDAAQYFALRFKITEAIEQAMRQKRVKGLASLINSRYYHAKIEIFSPQRADPHYIHSRNLPDGIKNLKDLYILQVGGGAIGSFLSQELAALGAGWGKNAKFTIIDHDRLSTENIGRHLLGFESVGKNKAEELEKHLLSLMPHLKIEGLNASVLKDKSVFTRKPDIILNATGSEDVSIAIELLLKNLYGQRPPIIHGWILGHGLAAQSFIRRSSGEACYMCLWEGQGESRRRRHELSKNPEEDLPVFAPCHHSFFPFIVNVAVTAANLMIEQLRNHLQEGKNETLIHYIFQKDKCFNRSNTSPSKSNTCPICNQE